MSLVSKETPAPTMRLVSNVLWCLERLASQ